MNEQTALIVGVGNRLSASPARRLHGEGFAIALAARDTEKRAVRPWTESF